MKFDQQIQLQFSITQNNCDVELMKKFKDYFNTGNLTNDGVRKKQFRIRGLDELDNLFMHLEEYPLLTKKMLDYQDFRKVHAMMKKGRHKTSEGFEEIVKIKNGMARNGKFDNKPKPDKIVKE